jgi:hypothetical protein
MQKLIVDTLSAVLAFFTGNRIERVGAIANSKPLPFLSKNTQIPPGCSTPTKDGS